jgi:hypothetical protein
MPGRRVNASVSRIRPGKPGLERIDRRAARKNLARARGWWDGGFLGTKATLVVGTERKGQIDRVERAQVVRHQRLPWFHRRF